MKLLTFFSDASHITLLLSREMSLKKCSNNSKLGKVWVRRNIVTLDNKLCLLRRFFFSTDTISTILCITTEDTSKTLCATLSTSTK